MPEFVSNDPSQFVLALRRCYQLSRNVYSATRKNPCVCIRRVDQVKLKLCLNWQVCDQFLAESRQVSDQLRVFDNSVFLLDLFRNGITQVTLLFRAENVRA